MTRFERERKMKQGDIVNLNHFSSRLNTLARVCSAEGLDIELEFVNKRNVKISEGEPAVLIYHSEKGFFVKGCTVLEKGQGEYDLKVRCDENCSNENRRLYGRYPVSYYSDLKFLKENKRHPVLIKDISKYGFKFYSEVELFEGQEIEISPYLDKKIIFITATIIRVLNRGKYFEYGARLSGDDFLSLQETMNIIKMTEQNYTSSYIVTNDESKPLISNFELEFDTVENKVTVNAPKSLDHAVQKLDEIIRRNRF